MEESDKPPSRKSQYALRRALEEAHIADMDVLPRRGRPESSNKTRSIAFSIPSDAEVMLRDDAAFAGKSASAYVTHLIRQEHERLVEVNPHDVLSALISRLSDKGATVAIMSKDSEERARNVSIQVGHDLGILFILDWPAPSGVKRPRLFFRWYQIWDDERYTPSLLPELDITNWATPDVVSMIMDGAKTARWKHHSQAHAHQSEPDEA